MSHDLLTRSCDFIIAHCNRKRQCFKQWSYYLVQQREQQQHKQIATEFYNLLLIRFVIM